MPFILVCAYVFSWKRKPSQICADDAKIDGQKDFDVHFDEYIFKKFEEINCSGAAVLVNMREFYSIRKY